MESVEIRTMIQRYENLLDNIRAAHRKAQTVVDNLETYSATHERITQIMESDLASRRQLLNGSPSMSHMKSAVAFKTAAAAMLDQGHIHLSARVEQRRLIASELADVRDTVAEHQREERRYEAAIQDLRRHLSIAMEREALSHV